MYIPLPESFSKHGLKPTGAIHVGAHHGQEYQDLKNAGVTDIVMIEPCQLAFDVLQSTYGRHTDVRLFRFACGEKAGMEMMKVSAQNDGMSNSLLAAKDHLILHPDIKFPYHENVQVVPLDEIGIDREKYNFLMMDVQGFEDRVLKGGVDTLRYIDIIYTEVNKGQVYQDCAQIEDMDRILSDFQRVETHWAIGDDQPSKWGDALYKRIKPAAFLSKLPIRIYATINMDIPDDTIILFNAINEAFNHRPSREFFGIKATLADKAGSTYMNMLNNLATGGLKFNIGLTETTLHRDGGACNQEKVLINIIQEEPLNPGVGTLLELHPYDELKKTRVSTQNFLIDKFTRILVAGLKKGDVFGLDLYPNLR